MSVRHTGKRLKEALQTTRSELFIDELPPTVAIDTAQVTLIVHSQLFDQDIVLVCVSLDWF